MTEREERRANESVALSSLADGARARLVRVEAGHGLRSRLTAMGLRPGAEVRVVNNRGAGPFVVAVEGTRIVLGRGMAHKVYVAPMAADSDAAVPGSPEGK
ncbi:MAG TPA: FeoA family protein [Phycisphaerae bacterium]|nr:FeoA family protein [Phycisphaerae bacterium]